MLICKHRINTIELLTLVPANYGVEIDIRSDGQNLYLAHDPFEEGTLLEDWLRHYKHSFLIANVKEEGLENKLREIFDKNGVFDWAFLDQSFPFLIKELKSGHKRTMVRLSEFEPVSIALGLETKPEWVWVDSFTGKTPSPDALRKLSREGYKFMIVSPELQSRNPAVEIDDIRNTFVNAGVEIDGVCTKDPNLWV